MINTTNLSVEACQLQAAASEVSEATRATGERGTSLASKQTKGAGRRAG